MFSILLEIVEKVEEEFCMWRDKVEELVDFLEKVCMIVGMYEK